MGEATSDLGEDVDESDAPTCANCGETILDSPTHRVVTWIEDGRTEHRHFCDDDCAAAWRADGD